PSDWTLMSSERCNFRGNTKNAAANNSANHQRGQAPSADHANHLRFRHSQFLSQETRANRQRRFQICDIFRSRFLATRVERKAGKLIALLTLAPGYVHRLAGLRISTVELRKGDTEVFGRFGTAQFVKG